MLGEEQQQVDAGLPGAWQHIRFRIGEQVGEQDLEGHRRRVAQGGGREGGEGVGLLRLEPALQQLVGERGVGREQADDRGAEEKVRGVRGAAAAVEAGGACHHGRAGEARVDGRGGQRGLAE